MIFGSYASSDAKKEYLDNFINRYYYLYDFLWAAPSIIDLFIIWKKDNNKDVGFWHRLNCAGQVKKRDLINSHLLENAVDKRAKID